MTSCLLLFTQNRFRKDKNPFKFGSTLKGKNLLPRSRFFPFRVDPFSEGTQKQFDEVTSPESVSIPIKRCLTEG